MQVHKLWREVVTRVDAGRGGMVGLRGTVRHRGGAGSFSGNGGKRGGIPVVGFWPFRRRRLIPWTSRSSISRVVVIRRGPAVGLARRVYGIFGSLLAALGRRAFCLALSRRRSEPRVLLTVFGAIHVNVARLAVDAFVDVGNLDLRIIALNVLPGATYLAVNGIAVILIESAYAFYLALVDVALLQRGQSVDRRLCGRRKGRARTQLEFSMRPQRREVCHGLSEGSIRTDLSHPMSLSHVGAFIYGCC